MKCRHCGNLLTNVFLDLGFAPPSNAYLSEAALRAPETYFPLKLFVCDQCGLVQTEDYARADELFSGDYAYFSSVSRSWLEHAARYAHMVTKRLALDSQSLVIEVASNDGYLLRNFVAAGIPCLGIEPTASTAQVAEKLGIPVLREFFGKALAGKLVEQGKRADLIIGNNVFAHVPDINDFTAGLQAALKPGGTITLEFPHLMRLVEQVQFDTVYHEHFSYLSLATVAAIFRMAGLRVCDVEELPTHGGSLRVYGCHADDRRQDTEAPARILAAEAQSGLSEFGGEVYQSFQARANAVKDGLLTFLIEQKRAGKTVAAYGAAAKGNTLLNYAGVKPDLLSFVCDAAPSKQGKFLPGSHIPIAPPEALAEAKPDFVLILPWNIADEVTSQLAYIREWGGKFAVAVPAMQVF
ncbi:methyltransferase domain-containing protein [Cupriavidus taiwanensis]|uniref:methyltransferase domain-containing protein n=1 Tax=Cupriavidus taiwanensis TaxID=164546 RepID=UPI0039C327DE